METQNERQLEEIERLRGLLIAKDAELGEAKGRLADLELHSHRLGSLAARLPPLIARPVIAVREFRHRHRAKRR